MHRTTVAPAPAPSRARIAACAPQRPRTAAFEWRDRTRGGRCACQAPVAPRSRPSPSTNCGSAPRFDASCSPPEIDARRLTRALLWRQLAAPEGSLPCSIAESKRRCGRHPPFKRRSLNRPGHRLRADDPWAISFVVHAPRPSSEHAGRSSRTRRGMTQTLCRHPMPIRCSRPPSSTRSTHRAAVFALVGSPHDLARQLDTALDIRSGVDPCEWMALRISN